MLYHVLSQRFCSQQPPKRYCTKVKAYEKIVATHLFPIFLEVNPRFPSEKKQQIPRFLLPRCHVATSRGGPVRCPRHVSYVGNLSDLPTERQGANVCVKHGKCNGGIIMLGLFMGYVPSGNQTWQWKNIP